MKFFKIKAFTLAEVLVTLGLIGIVAAMTIPGLITNIRSKIRENQVKVLNTKMRQGMDLLNTQNGIGPYYADTLSFVNALSKTMKIVTICDSNNLTKCMTYDKINLSDGTTFDVNMLKTGRNFNMPDNDEYDYTSNNAGIILADGTTMILTWNKKCPISDPDSRNEHVTACLSGIFDLNGRQGPNSFGDDILPLKTYNRIIEDNALHVDWKKFLPDKGPVYIISNPPFLGYSR